MKNGTRMFIACILYVVIMWWDLVIDDSIVPNTISGLIICVIITMYLVLCLAMCWARNYRKKHPELFEPLDDCHDI